jgi:hypothetical protein
MMLHEKLILTIDTNTDALNVILDCSDVRSQWLASQTSIKKMF